MPDQDPSTATKRVPLVSVIMASYCGKAHLPAALNSVLSQTHETLELIVVDDASDDGSVDILRKVAAEDRRMTFVALDENRGPGGARNVALDMARGDWVAIVDADDLIHPRRIERLLAVAQTIGADMVADDMVKFGNPAEAGQTLLGCIDGIMQVGPADLLQSDMGTSGTSSMGYLKPLVKRDRLATLRYDETLKIGEDFDLYFRLLLDGARFHVVSDPTYLYRRHSASVSHRLSVEALESLIAAQDRAEQGISRCPTKAVEAALIRRKSVLAGALRYENLVAAIKARRRLEATGMLLRHPQLLDHLRRSVLDRYARKRAETDKDLARQVRSIVLAAPDVIDTLDAPSGALRIPVLPMRPPGGRRGDDHRDLARQLALIWSQGPVEVFYGGEAGLDALGYLPELETPPRDVLVRDLS